MAPRNSNSQYQSKVHEVQSTVTTGSIRPLYGEHRQYPQYRSTQNTWEYIPAVFAVVENPKMLPAFKPFFFFFFLFSPPIHYLRTSSSLSPSNS